MSIDQAAKPADSTPLVAKSVNRSGFQPGSRGRAGVAVLLSGMALLACSGPAPSGELPPLPPGVAATASAEVAQLPAPPAEAVPDAAARTAISGFATEAQRVVGSGVELTEVACRDLAGRLTTVVAPDDLFAAAGRVEDPDLRALLLNARARVGAVLASCTQGEPVDVAEAREAVALLQARLGEKR